MNSYEYLIQYFVMVDNVHLIFTELHIQTACRIYIRLSIPSIVFKGDILNIQYSFKYSIVHNK